MAQIYKFRARTYAGFDDEQAQIYGEELSRLIEETDGKLTTKAVVDRAKSKKSPLHDYFDWDNNIASEKWREHQARNLVNHIEIIYDDEDKEPETIRAFLYTKSEESIDKYILPSIHVMTDTNLRAQALAQLRNEAINWTKRARKYEEFAGIVAAIEELPLFELEMA